jgi:hypothetical protein
VRASGLRGTWPERAEAKWPRERRQRQSLENQNRKKGETRFTSWKFSNIHMEARIWATLMGLRMPDIFCWNCPSFSRGHEKNRKSLSVQQASSAKTHVRDTIVWIFFVTLSDGHSWCICHLLQLHAFIQVDEPLIFVDFSKENTNQVHDLA